MQPEVKYVKEYWQNKLRFVRFDTTVLINSIAAMPATELHVLSVPSEEVPSHLRKQYNYLMTKVFHRHSDALMGKTLFYRENNETHVRLSRNSSITEIVDDVDVYNELKSAGISSIKDLDTTLTIVVPSETLAKAQNVYSKTPVENFSDFEVTLLCKE